MPLRTIVINLLLLWQCLIFPIAGHAASRTPGEELIAVQLQRWLDTPEGTPIQVGGVALHTLNLIKEMYIKRHYLPLWSAREQLKPQVNQLLEVIKSVKNEGLDPFDYHLFKIVQLLNDINQEHQGHFQPLKAAALDLLLSDAFLTIGADLAYGRVSPDSHIRAPYRFGEHYDLVSMLEQAVKKEKLQKVIDILRPPNEGFSKMRAYLAKYRHLEKMEAWPFLLNRVPLRLGMDNQVGVKSLKHKLRLLGDLQDSTTAPDVFDKQLENAVKHYQIRHGLSPTGIVDDQTKAWLNMPLKDLIEIMEINMERWRWLPRELGNQYLLVNIPDFTVKAIRHGKVDLCIKVVVGKEYSKTPIFSDRLRYIVINPDWTIPPNLVIKSKLNRIRRDPEYLKSHHITVFKGWGENAEEIDPDSVNWKKVGPDKFYAVYRLVQSPGPANPLGKLKFMFPNEYNVYLHGTNQPELFGKETRSFSSGCIRLSDPVKLAVYCLKNQPVWSRSHIVNAIASGYQQKIRLTYPLPIHILYWTAWVGEDGVLNFRSDIYDRDQAIAKAFFQSAGQ